MPNNQPSNRIKQGISFVATAIVLSIIDHYTVGIIPPIMNALATALSELIGFIIRPIELPLIVVIFFIGFVIVWTLIYVRRLFPSESQYLVDEYENLKIVYSLGRDGLPKIRDLWCKHCDTNVRVDWSPQFRQGKIVIVCRNGHEITPLSFRGRLSEPDDREIGEMYAQYLAGIEYRFIDQMRVENLKSKLNV